MNKFVKAQVNLSSSTKTAATSIPQDYEAQKLTARIGLVRTLALLLLFGSVGTVFLGLAILLLGESQIGGIIVAAALVTSLCHALPLLILQKNPGIRQLNYASYFQLSTVLISVSVGQFLLGSANSIPIIFLLVPALATVSGLATGEIIVFSGLAAALMSLFFSLEKLVKVYHPLVDTSGYPVVGLFFLLLLFSVVAIGLGVFTRRLRSAVTLSQQQTVELNRALQKLAATGERAVSVGASLSQVSTEVSVASGQQASSAQEQLAATRQVTSALEELKETAEQIMQAARAVSSYAEQTFSIARGLGEASQIAQTTAQEGYAMVEQTLKSVAVVNEKVELLAQKALNTTEQADKAAVILNLMADIASETHLLALNASIEAAGAASVYAGSIQAVGSAGGRSTGASFQGERFGVIAQEVKQLSDRSREATDEVRAKLGEIQGAIAALVLAAEEARKETSNLFNRSRLTGDTIERLDSVINETARQSQEIVGAIEEVKRRCLEITSATGQQSSASEQLLQMMQALSNLSQQSSQAVSTIATSINNLDQELKLLNLVLAQGVSREPSRN
jgi:methyl-accepting chemotaxis protein